MLTVNMVGTGLCTALLPFTLQTPRPVLLTWITLTVSGERLPTAHVNRSVRCIADLMPAANLEAPLL